MTQDTSAGGRSGQEGEKFCLICGKTNHTTERCYRRKRQGAKGGRANQVEGDEEYEEEQGEGNVAVAYKVDCCGAEVFDRGDYMLNASLFEEADRTFGPFDLDGAASVSGDNSHCTTWCSRERDFLREDVAGLNIWINPPFKQLRRFLLHYLKCKDKAPMSTSACILVPYDESANWWPLVKDMQIVKVWKTGAELFTLPSRSERGERRTLRACHFPVALLRDSPAESAAVSPPKSKPSSVSLMIDSGCTDHLTPVRDILQNYTQDLKAAPRVVRVADGRVLKVVGKGSILLKSTVDGITHLVELKNVLLVPEFHCTLVSVGKLLEDGAVVKFVNNSCTVEEKGRVVLTGKRCQTGSKPKLFYVNNAVVCAKGSCNAAVSTAENAAQLWHNRMGHMNYKALGKLAGGMADGIDLDKKDCELAAKSTEVCEGCAFGKMTRKPRVLVIPEPFAKSALFRVCADLVGPFQRQSIGGSRYALVVVDEFSKFCEVSTLRTKDQAAQRLVEIITKWERATGRKVMRLRTDRGGEFMSEELQLPLRSMGIVHEPTPAHSPESNGLAERTNRTLVERARSMLQAAHLPFQFWGEAMVQASYIRNVSPASGVPATPWENFYQRKPNLSSLKTFGALAYLHVPDHARKKLDAKAVKGVLLGWQTPCHGIYRVWVDGQVRIHKDVQVDEHKWGWKSSPEDEEFSLDEVEGFDLEGGEKVTEEPAAQPVTHFGQHPPMQQQSAATEQLHSEETDKQQSVDVHVNDLYNESDDSDSCSGDRESDFPYLNSGRNTPSSSTKQSAVPKPSQQNVLTSPVSPQVPTPAESQQQGDNTAREQTPPPAARELHPLQLQQQQSRIPAPPGSQQLPQPMQQQPQVRRSQRQNLGVPPVRYGFGEGRGSTAQGNAVAADEGSQRQQQPDPETVQQAMNSPQAEEWKQAMNEEYEALLSNGTWEVVNKPENEKVLPCKWVFRTKRHADKSIDRYKARLVAGGHRQEAGVDYDEVYSPVSKYTSFRTLVAKAAVEGLELECLDISNAFLNGNLDVPAYMEQPELFTTGNPNQCLKLRKSLYGLCQAPLEWYKVLTGYLSSIGFRSSDDDEGLWVKPATDKTPAVYVVLWVDDFLIACADTNYLRTVKKMVLQRFKGKDLGIARRYLGIQVERTGDGIKIHQEGYILDVLKRFGMQDCHGKFIPLAAGADVGPRKEEEAVMKERHRYPTAIGCLLHLANTTRPDLSASVSILAQHSSNPAERHWEQVKGVLRYLKQTSKTGLLYRAGGHSATSPICYSDSDFGGERGSRRSRTGYALIYGGAAVGWQSRLQNLITLSSTEAEYVALSAAVREAKWAKRIFHQLDVQVENPLVVYTDSDAARKLANREVSGARTKHIDIQHHFVRRAISDEVVSLRYVRSAENPADLLTKPLPKERHLNHCAALGLDLGQ